MSGAAPELILRPSASRGHAHHGWLKSYHTFSFADYYSETPREQAWGSLRVINEDRVDVGRGFPPHPHREFEIFSYVIDGHIKHEDSMGNTEDLKRGEIQMTSAGTGIRHGEGNGGKDDLHFLQCWAVPSTKGLKPAYYTRHYTDAEKTNVLLPVVAPIGSSSSVVDARDGSGPTPIHSPLTMYASILKPGQSLTHTFTSEGAKKGYVHLIMRQKGYRGPRESIPSDGPEVVVELIEGGKKEKLVEGDGLYLDRVQGTKIKFENVGKADAEFVFFDLDG